jgi:hypothetical protein
MGSFRKNSVRPQLERLEDRCVPGSVLDLMANPLPPPLGDGQSPVVWQAPEAAVSLTTVNLSHTDGTQETAANVDSAFSADAQPARVNSSTPTVIDGALPATGASFSPQDDMTLASPVAAGEQTPFKGSLEGMDIGTGKPPIVSAQITATGNATHLGEFTYSALITVDTTTRMGTGTFVFTAANGDTVFGALSGHSTPTAPNTLTIVENMSITGGTGRFAGATGSFALTRMKNTVTNVTAGSFTGTISSPGP